MRHSVILLLLTLSVSPRLGAAEWHPVEGHIMTRWGRQVTPANVWQQYPRPQMERPQWLNLNGLWEYAIVGEAGEWKQGQVENAIFDPLPRRATQPQRWDGRILVPFAVESALSGVGKLVRPDQLLWYRRTFAIPAAWRGQRVLLNFEAVDWHAVVFVNGRQVGENRGGYVPFSLDITEALTRGASQELAVVVWDPSNMGDQSVGKQSLPENRQGYRYTPTTGIWQTVWLEPVPAASIESVRAVPDVDRSRVAVTVSARGSTARAVVKVTVQEQGKPVASATGAPGAPIPITLAKPKLWSPEQPFLYDLTVTLADGGTAPDSVRSYFGMRKVSLGKDARGITRVFLNNRPLPFQFGPLDQGYWPDGVLTPPSDEAAAADLQYLKDIACNMVRVHVNVRPDRWYYHCDRLGLLVWQDMVCTRKFESKITTASASQWEAEQRRMLDHLGSHPSIIEWIVFNEGWGQYDTQRLTEWTEKYDPSRLATSASGWTDFQGVGQVRDIHDYSFYPSIPPTTADPPRAIVLGEFGGFDVAVPGHMWNPDQKVAPHSDAVREGSREKYASGADWLRHYQDWVRGWRYLIGQFGLSAGVYTQIADVEHEPNGWLTYDREVSKIAVADLKRIHQTLYGEPPHPGRPLLADSSASPQTWRYSTGELPPDWYSAGFDDAGWSTGPGPFGNGKVRLRRIFSVEHLPGHAAILAHSSGKVTVYLNGTLAKSFVNGGVRDGIGVSVLPLTREVLAAIHTGRNLIAVEAEPGKESIIDIGLVELPE